MRASQHTHSSSRCMNIDGTIDRDRNQIRQVKYSPCHFLNSGHATGWTGWGSRTLLILDTAMPFIFSSYDAVLFFLFLLVVVLIQRCSCGDGGSGQLYRRRFVILLGCYFLSMMRRGQGHAIAMRGRGRRRRGEER